MFDWIKGVLSGATLQNPHRLPQQWLTAIHGGLGMIHGKNDSLRSKALRHIVDGSDADVIQQSHSSRLGNVIGAASGVLCYQKKRRWVDALVLGRCSCGRATPRKQPASCCTRRNAHAHQNFRFTVTAHSRGRPGWPSVTPVSVN